tara:strand:+ start:30 stop:509 length:480 start_codon:yes stop_codon:yes gene_type:complete
MGKIHVFFIILYTTIFVLALRHEFANARNEYLNSYTNECREGEIDLAITKRESEQDYRTYDTSDYDNDSHELRLTFRKYLGTTCTKEMRKVYQENMELRQQLELLKMCRKVVGRELPVSMNLLKAKCAGTDPNLATENKTDKPAYDVLMETIKKENEKK